MSAPTYGGMTVLVSPALPIPPSDREVARRLVRHGYADVLAWLGEPVGPKPDDKVHAVLGLDPASKDARTLFGVWFVSADLYEQLKTQAVAS